MGRFSEMVTQEAGGADVRAAPRVVIVSGPAPGAGKTTLIANLAVALLKSGRAVGLLDLDFDTRALARWAARRAKAADAERDDFVMPATIKTRLAPPPDGDALEVPERARLSQTIAALSESCDVVLIDAPPRPSSLGLAAHVAADLALTLSPEALISLDGLFELGEDGVRSERPGIYSRMIWEARRKKAERGGSLDWLMVRARAADSPSVEMTQVLDRADKLLGARGGLRIRESGAWRQGMEAGLCALDAPRGPQAELVAQELRDLVIVGKLAGLEGAALGF